MTDTPDLRPVGDLPHSIGKTAARALSLRGITSLEIAAQHSTAELLALHGVGPRAVSILTAALADKGLEFANADPSPRDSRNPRAIRSAAGAATDAYPPGARAELRNEWPD